MIYSSTTVDAPMGVDSVGSVGRPTVAIGGEGILGKVGIPVKGEDPVTLGRGQSNCQPAGPNLNVIFGDPAIRNSGLPSTKALSDIEFGSHVPSERNSTTVTTAPHSSNSTVFNRLDDSISNSPVITYKIANEINKNTTTALNYTSSSVDVTCPAAAVMNLLQQQQQNRRHHDSFHAAAAPAAAASNRTTPSNLSSDYSPECMEREVTKRTATTAARHCSPY
eukprot:Trichotokara_eunicae@DN4251_c0_g1_i2.p1